MISRRGFLGTAAAPFVQTAPAKRPPNVLFVVADDLTSTALGCYGHPLVQSPNIDSIAKSGVRFDRMYCQFALCAPSRASFLTGMRPDSTKVLTNGPDFRDALPNHVTLPQLFKNNGYQAIREGKMYHMGVPGTVGTDRWQDAASWTHNGSPQGKELTSQGEKKELTPNIAQGVAMTYIRTPNPNEQADYDAANRTIAHLEKHRNDPFFMALGFVRPHVPFVAPSEFFDRYPLHKIKPYVNPPGDLDDIPALVPKIIGAQAHDMKMNGDQIREALRAYYAAITFMDSQLGRVLQTLNRLKLRDNTIVVFMSDHGWHLGEHHFWQKRSLMEESTKVPFMISAPGQKARNKVTRSLTELVDLYPTVAQLAGLTPPANLEGQSLLPLLNNPAAPHKAVARTQLNQATNLGRTVRTNDFRYIRWAAGAENGEEFYDHRTDPAEFKNVVNESAYRAEVDRHRAMIPA